MIAYKTDLIMDDTLKVNSPWKNFINLSSKTYLILPTSTHSWEQNSPCSADYKGQLVKYCTCDTSKPEQAKKRRFRFKMNQLKITNATT